MLELTRKVNQDIMIGDDICIRFLAQKGTQICIGIDAPRDIEVYRREIYEQRKQGIEKPPAKARDNKKKTKDYDWQ